MGKNRECQYILAFPVFFSFLNKIIVPAHGVAVWCVYWREMFLIQSSFGVWLWKKSWSASRMTSKKDLFCERQVCDSDSARSIRRCPTSLDVPMLILRRITP